MIYIDDIKKSYGSKENSSCGVHPDKMKEKGIISLPLQIVLPDQENPLF